MIYIPEQFNSEWYPTLADGTRWGFGFHSWEDCFTQCAKLNKGESKMEQLEIYGPRGNADWTKGPLTGETYYLGVEPHPFDALYALKGYDNRKRVIWCHWAFSAYDEAMRAYDRVLSVLLATRDASMDDYHHWSYAFEGR